MFPALDTYKSGTLTYVYLTLVRLIHYMCVLNASKTKIPYVSTAIQHFIQYKPLKQTIIPIKYYIHKRVSAVICKHTAKCTNTN